MAWLPTLSRRLLPGSVWRGSLGPIHYLVAFVFLIRVISLARLTSSPFLFPSGGDMRFYDDWAQRILRGELTDHLAFFGLPLYPYVLALFYKVFGYTPFIPALLQTIADTITATLLYQISVTVFGQTSGAASFLTRHRGRIVGVTAVVAWAWFVPAQAFSLAVMPTALAVTVFWLVIAWIVKNPEMPTPARSLVLGALVGLAATGVATILFALLLLLAAIFLKPAKASKRPNLWLSRIWAAALLLLGAGIGTSPCWIHNHFVARDPVFLSAHSGINFWIGNNPASKGYPNFPAGMRADQASMLQDSTTLAEAEMGRALRRSEVSAFWSAKAKAYIAGNPGAWLRLLWQKALNFWNAFEYRRPRRNHKAAPCGGDLAGTPFWSSGGARSPRNRSGLAGIPRFRVGSGRNPDANGLRPAGLRDGALSPRGRARFADFCVLRAVASGGELFGSPPFDHRFVLCRARRRHRLRLDPANRSSPLGFDRVYLGSPGAGFRRPCSRRTGVAARPGLCTG